MLALAASTLYAAAPPDAAEIVRRSVSNTIADWAAAPRYSFNERDVTSQKGTKAYRVLMIDGSPYNELIAANGKPLDSGQAAAENRKLQTEIAKRKHESADERQQRIDRYSRERHQDNELLQQMIEAMNFQLAGEETVDGRRCYVLEGTPKPDYRPINRDTRVLRGMRGKMWIDESSYQWVKVQAQVFRPVSFGLFIAKVAPGTQFLLEQRPLQGNLWLPSHFSVRVKASILGFHHNSTDDETYWNYTLGSPGAENAVAARRSGL